MYHIVKYNNVCIVICKAYKEAENWVKLAVLLTSTCYQFYWCWYLSLYPTYWTVIVYPHRLDSSVVLSDAAHGQCVAFCRPAAALSSTAGAEWPPQAAHWTAAWCLSVKPHLRDPERWFPTAACLFFYYFFYTLQQQSLKNERVHIQKIPCVFNR